MDIDYFLKELKDKFFQNGTFFKRGNAAQESCLNVIKSYLLKKNLVIVSKVEWDKLKNKDMYDHIKESIDALNPNRVD
jgi:hypothetical protein